MPPVVPTLHRLNPQQAVGRRAGLLLLLASALTPVCAWSQGIVRWVDDKGQVHYSDHAPSGNARVETVAPPMPPSEPDPAPVAAPAASTGWGNQPNPSGSASAVSSADAASAADANRKRQADQQKALAEAQRKADEATVARCKSGHETYCNRGADYIRQIDHNRNVMNCLNVNQLGASVCNHN